MTYPPERPWVLECACGRIRRAVADTLLVCDYCDRPLPAAPHPVWPHESSPQTPRTHTRPRETP
jgi:hypothetical protein